MMKKVLFGLDVRFHSSVVWTWWRGNDSSDKGVIECIESTSGLLPDSSKEISGRDSHGGVAPMVSTRELMSLFLQVYHRLAPETSIVETPACIDMDHNQTESPLPINNTLIGIRGIKRRYSPMHESFKELLLTEHKVLSQWRRREDRNKCTFCTDKSTNG